MKMLDNASIDDSVQNLVLDSVYASLLVRDSVRNLVHSPVRDLVYYSVRGSVWDSVNNSVRSLVQS